MEIRIQYSKELLDILRQTASISKSIKTNWVSRPVVPVVIDFGNAEWISPRILAVLAAFLEDVRLMADIEVDCQNMNRENVNYISRMDFFREVGFPYEEFFTRWDSSGRFIPITRVRKENRFQIVEKIKKIMESQWSGLNRELLSLIDWSLGEIVDNIFTHSRTKIDGFVVAQYYSASSEIQIAVIDTGIGIPNRLRENREYQRVSNEEALRLAVEERVTSDSFGNGGNGLYYTKRIIQENQGKLRITSDDVQLVIWGSHQYTCMVPRWSGTIVELEIRTDVPVQPEQIWEQDIPPLIADYLEGDLW